MRQLTLLLVAAASLMSTDASATQAATGTIIGTVRDAQGAVLPGAVVRVSSPALIGGPEVAITNPKGQLRFPALPPGIYDLEIEFTGFQAYRVKGLSVRPGGTLEQTVILALHFEASLDVEGEGSRIEARGSGFDSRFGREDIQAIPMNRFSMFGPIRGAPGVSPTSPGSVSTNSISAFGSGTNENSFYIDGTNFTCPCSGEARSEPGVDFIQEVQVQSVGASPEFGNMQGAVVNVITRQGGDRFSFDASYYWQTAGLTSQPVQISGTTGGPMTGYERVKYHDITSNLGGPVRRDRLWFFAGYQHLRDYDSQPGTDPAFPRTYEQDKIFAKLTWRLSPRLQLVQSYHREFWVNPEVPTVTKPFEATLRRHASVPAITFGHLTHTFSSNTVWDVRAGRFTFDRQDDPSTGSTTTPSRTDRFTKVLSGGPPSFGGLMLIRTTAKATVSHYRPSWLGADHQWRIGSEVERGEHHLSTITPTGVSYIDDGGKPFQSVSRAPTIEGGVFISASGFASDAITIGPALTINAGLRFDHSRAVSQDLPALDQSGNQTGQIVKGSGTLYTWNMWSPRLGVTAKLTADGRTILRASYGRFVQGVLTGELAPFHPASMPITTMSFDPATGGYTTFLSRVGQENLLLDGGTRAPRTDEYSIGVDREIGSALSVAIAYVGKDGANFTGWTDVGGEYREEERRLPDARTIPVFVLVNNTSDRRFLMTNPAGYSMSYNGVVLAAQKRRSGGWQAFGSYTLSRVSGLQASSGANAAGSQVSTIAGAPYLTFGRDPNSLTNAGGRLPNDRPHMVRVMAGVDIPRTGFVVAANVQHFSGKPWAETTVVPLPPQGDQRVLLEPRGSRRLSSQTLVDVRLSRMISLGGTRRAEVLFDVLNALDDTAEESLITDNVFTKDFGQPSTFVDPRRAMISIRLMLGR